MKVLFVIFSICVASTLGLTDEQKALLKSYRETCIAETSVDPAVIESVKTGVIPEADESFDCFAACFLKRIGTIDEAGVPRSDIFRSKAETAKIPKEKIDAIIERCYSLTGANTCQTAGAIFRCYLEMKAVNVLF